MSDDNSSLRKSTLADPPPDSADATSLSDTNAHASAATHHVSDVVVAESEATTDVRQPPLPPEVSDVVLAPSCTDVKLAASVSSTEIRIAAAETGVAPSFRAPTPPAPPAAGAANTPEQPLDNRPARDKAPLALLPGAKVDDFEIVRLLGRGAFGHVYLARQLSLDRLVALKISANRGSEGRTMARLEHQHIVQVFSEKVDADFNQRLLCMQLVPGIGLDKLIAMLQEKQRERATRSEERADSTGHKNSPAPSPQPLAPDCNWTGAEMLDIIDRSGALPTALDPSALHDRQALSKMDAIEATAWFGARMAEALDFAHRNGVLHRDIKPANILVNPYGQPMLADFNISSQPVGSETSGEEMFGGTFAYMAPEHLDAFNPGDSTGHEAVTARSDIYSLGLVLEQLLEARVSLPVINRKGKMADTLRAMADDRRRPAPACKSTLPGARMTLERTIRRCLEPNPEDRFDSGAELAAQLAGCERMREAEKKLPKVPAMFAPLLRQPFLWLVILVVLPQIAGSIVNVTYNTQQIVGALTDAQQEQFKQLVTVYNAIIYPIAVAVFIVVVRRVRRTWSALQSGERLPEGEVQIARRKALRLPRWIAALTAFGWFPGAFLFPLTIMLRTPVLEFEYAVHFLASFCLSGLIALAYSLCGVEFIVLRALYRGLWRDAQNFTETARYELRNTHKQLTRIQTLAILIPLGAAIVFLMLGDTSSARALTFRGMVAALIVLGILGFHTTGAITNHLSRVVVAITNTKD